MGRKTPNSAFAEHLAECAVSNAGLAFRVGELATRRGLTAPRYDHTSVARWLRGEQPRGCTPDLIADVMTGLLGRRITRTDLGMSSPAIAPDLGFTYETDLNAAVEAACDLYGTDVERRALLAKSAYATVAYATPALRWMTAPASHLTERAGTRRVGMTNVAAIHEVIGTFRRLDCLLGGGYARTTVVQYLNDEVAPLLRHGAYTAEVGKSLFSASAELTLLCAWMAYDLEQHAISQRYLIQSLRLAQAANDSALGGEVLAAMSCQAAYLGEASDAVDLARAAAHSARRSGSVLLLAESQALEAHGHALAADPRTCAALLQQAHLTLDQACPDGAEPEWIGYFDPAYLEAKTGRALLDGGDSRRAVTAMRASLQMRGGFARGRAFNLAVLASALLDAGDVDEGCAMAQRASDAADGINSARAVTELRHVAGQLIPLATVPAARQVMLSLPPAATGPGRRAAQ